MARLQQEERLLRRIDSNGLRVKFSQILGCTSRQLRRELERIGEIHICRLKDCQENHELHIQEFAGIDHEVLVDLHRFAHGSPRWLLGVGWRCIVASLGLFFRFLRCCWRRCCRRRGTRVIRDDSGTERALDPDSESEVEVDEAACQGVRIGIIVDGAMRPLAPDGCNDVAADEEVTLLDEDIEVSDIRPPGAGQTARVPLCPHHKQLYQSASSARKCGVMTCFKATSVTREQDQLGRIVHTRLGCSITSRRGLGERDTAAVVAHLKLNAILKGLMRRRVLSAIGWKSLDRRHQLQGRSLLIWERSSYHHHQRTPGKLRARLARKFG